MPTIDERVAYLEGRVEEHTRGFGELREIGLQLDLKLDRRLDAADQRFDRVDGRIDALDQKVDRFRDELASRIEALDHKVDRRFETVDQKIGTLDRKLSRQFLWTLSVQVAVLLAVLGALVGT